MNIEKLNKKLVDQVEFLKDQEQAKKDYNKSIGEVIKEAKKMVNALAEAIKSRSFDALEGAFDCCEIEELSKSSSEVFECNTLHQMS